ncbi:Ammonium Transporter Family [Rhizoctonia solani]|uniref:Ammonium Transporter Family n=1 Tax=Rhizoctonia solani TaxID=456999 RepID=A0A8H7M574_9AGAM|nr:Ammonium Transporter Family [Rhizoctonia solani]
MPNITYSVSNDIEYYDAASGETVVYNLGDIAWVLACTALVWIMIPGVGFFYSGLLRRKNALSMIYFSMLSLAVVSFQWFFWGYSLAFSDGASAFIGDLKYFALKGVLDQPSMGSTRIPALVFCVYQLMFAAITPMLALGGFAERCRLGPVALFVFVWTTVVYDPIACWTWNGAGWSFVMGGLDFAGGTPVHISSGTAALAISIYLGKRSGYGPSASPTSPIIPPTSSSALYSSGSVGSDSMEALPSLPTCALLKLVLLEKKWSVVGFCSGAISGLVAITPASGYVGAPAAVAFGVVAGTACNFATQLKFLLHYDECLDVFASHGIGGMVGNIMTALFAQSSVAAFDGFSEIPGGWFDHHYIQLGYQIADSLAGFGYSFVMTTLICWIFHFIPFLCLRTTEAAEALGMDDAEMGEFAYDYVGLDAEHGFPSERGALPPISGAAANHELGSGVGGREGPHQRISADKGRGSVGSSNEKIRG